MRAKKKLKPRGESETGHFDMQIAARRIAPGDARRSDPL